MLGSEKQEARASTTAQQQQASPGQSSSVRVGSMSHVLPSDCLSKARMGAPRAAPHVPAPAEVLGRFWWGMEMLWMCRGRT